MKNLSKYSIYAIFTILLFGILIGGCQQSQTTANDNEIDTLEGYPVKITTDEDRNYPSPRISVETKIHKVPTPKPGRAVLVTTIYSLSMQSLLPNSLVYLTRAVGDNQDELFPILGGPRVEIGDVAGYTDDTGNVVFDDVPLGNYFIIVSFQPDWLTVMESKESTKARLIIVDDDKTYNLGRLYIP